MEKGFQLEELWKDNDVIELRASAWNGEFGGVADVYVGHDFLEDAIKSILGFPINSLDKREFQLGAFGEQFAGGGVSLHFYCKDLAGHAVVDIKLESNFDHTGHCQTALVSIELEAASVDAFIAQLQNKKDQKIAAFLAANR